MRSVTSDTASAGVGLDVTLEVGVREVGGLTEELPAQHVAVVKEASDTVVRNRPRSRSMRALAGRAQDGGSLRPHESSNAAARSFPNSASPGPP